MRADHAPHATETVHGPRAALPYRGRHEPQEASHHCRHRRGRRGVQGCRVLRAQRQGGGLGADQGQDPGDRRPDGLAPQQRRPRAVRRAQRRDRPGRGPAGLGAGHRAVLHAADLRRRGGPRADRHRVAAPGHRRRQGRGGRLPQVVGRAPGGRCAAGRPARAGPPAGPGHRAGAARGRDRARGGHLGGSVGVDQRRRRGARDAGVPGRDGAPQDRPGRGTRALRAHQGARRGLRRGHRGTGPGRCAVRVHRLLGRGGRAGHPAAAVRVAAAHRDRLRQRRDGGGRAERHPGDGCVGTRPTVPGRLGRQRAVPAGAPRADRGQPAGHGVRRAGGHRAALADRGHPGPRHPAPLSRPRAAWQHRALRGLSPAPAPGAAVSAEAVNRRSLHGVSRARPACDPLTAVMRAS
ncbi:hypothetical protein SBRY_70369 [Actinacidiphila bryophytorum]|uniref:Uncharacterized protein n=1 Tax=Actinacidiphila bryophytorum TaxID=1436133 RepID=A0A9W4H6Q4_9ACTN|nr:hypothetical protein SBRY_70369 [Actinacidiphila bryophytorum]